MFFFDHGARKGLKKPAQFGQGSLKLSAILARPKLPCDVTGCILRVIHSKSQLSMECGQSEKREKGSLWGNIALLVSLEMWAVQTTLRPVEEFQCIISRATKVTEKSGFVSCSDIAWNGSLQNLRRCVPHILSRLASSSDLTSALERGIFAQKDIWGKMLYRQ